DPPDQPTARRSERLAGGRRPPGPLPGLHGLRPGLPVRRPLRPPDRSRPLLVNRLVGAGPAATTPLGPGACAAGRPLRDVPLSEPAPPADGSAPRRPAHQARPPDAAHHP